MQRPFVVLVYGCSYGPFDTEFEDVLNRLGELNRLFAELDGSFVWTGNVHGQLWQLDGVLYDANSRLQYLDLKGWCPFAEWQQLMTLVTAVPKSEFGNLGVLVLPERKRMSLREFTDLTWQENQQPH